LPDTSPNVPVEGAPTSREASAQAAAVDDSVGGPPAGTRPAAVRATISVPESVSMVALLGSADELLRLVEDEVDTDVHVRGNEIAVTGQPADNAFAVAVFDELIALLGTGQTLRPDSVRRVIGMLRAGGAERPADVLSLDILSRRGRTIRPKTLNQKHYVDAIDAHTVVFGIGPAGTGKTYLAMAQAVSFLLAKKVTRIILARPAVEAGEKLGFLPGDLQEKVNPYLRPLYDALYDMLDVERAERLIERGTVEVAPIAFMRGRTLNDAFVILDEAQNTTSEQMKMFLTRLGFGSKAVITGDITQIDLPTGRTSGLVEAMKVVGNIEGVSFIRFDDKDVVRHQMVQQIVKAYESYGGSRQ
jgi:phosphate starvation-inducible protein PhoH and related proteins